MKLDDREMTCIEAEVGAKVVRTNEKDVHLLALTHIKLMSQKDII